MPRRKQRTPELRGRVLDAALAALASDGVPGFTARRIAGDAATSVPAVYELFGDKAGLVRAVFFEGFRRLQAELDRLEPSDDAVADLLAVVHSLRAFARANPVLTQVMFSRPFADFDPGSAEREAGAATRRAILRRVRRAVDEGAVAGDPVDVAHAVLALAQGLAAQEAAGWLGTSAASIDRRWALAATALVRGLAP